MHKLLSVLISSNCLRRPLLAAVWLVGAFAAASAPARCETPEPLVIVVLDGSKISYEAEAEDQQKIPSQPRKNGEVLQELLPKLAPEKATTVHYRDVQAPDGSGPWIEAGEIAQLKPHLVVLHWSAFKTKERAKERAFECDPDSPKAAQRECARNLMTFLNDIFRASEPRPKFIIYTRKDHICLPTFKSGVRELIPIDSEVDRSIALISMSPFARGGNFLNPVAIQDMKSLVRHFVKLPAKPKWNDIQGLCLLSS